MAENSEIDKQKKNYILMNTWFKFFLLPKSPVTVFVDLDLQEFGLLGLRGLPWISQVNQSTGLPSIFLRAHTEH